MPTSRVPMPMPACAYVSCLTLTDPLPNPSTCAAVVDPNIGGRVPAVRLDALHAMLPVLHKVRVWAGGLECRVEEDGGRGEPAGTGTRWARGHNSDPVE
jgi:hypothetical protein